VLWKSLYLKIYSFSTVSYIQGYEEKKIKAGSVATEKKEERIMTYEHFQIEGKLGEVSPRNFVYIGTLVINLSKF